MSSPATMRERSHRSRKKPRRILRPARRTLAEQGYVIVLNMGDQESDLAGGHAERTFKMPNPFYRVP